MEFECLKRLRMSEGEVRNRIGGSKKFRLKTKRKKKNKQIKLPKKYKGKEGYRNYLKTKHWKAFKYFYYTRNIKTCYCCGDESSELHHIRYNNLFHEEESDVISVCRNCHEKIHTMILNEKEITLKNAHNILKRLIYMKVD